MNTLSMLEHFPQVLNPRKIQEEIIGEIEEKINSGYKKIIISAPTGVGKSAIGITLAQYFGNSFIVTASKHLQDQYSDDYPILYPVKGKSNFPCLKLMKEKKIEDPILASTLHLTCEKGKCKEGKAGSSVKHCEYKPNIEEIEVGEKPVNMCDYYVQKYVALTSDHSLWNYSAFFQLMLNKKAFAKYIGKSVSIFDEAHKIEDQIINFIGIRITKKQLDECEINVTRYNLQDIDVILELLDSMRKTYAELLRRMEDENDKDYKKYSRYTDQLEKAARTYGNISQNKENFVINEPQKDLDGKFDSIEIKPLDISTFIEYFFNTEHQIFMSATIDKKSFCETMGLDESEVAFIDTPKSPFPLENRKVDFLNIKKMNSRSTFEDKMEIVTKIDELLTKHSTDRGLILTSSVANCIFIKKYLSPKNRNRVKICHAQNPGQKTQNQVLKEHENDQTSVLLSSSLWEGIDLKDELSRFQIIAKVPYLPLTEKRTIQKMKKYPLWYESQTLMKLLQGFGRSIRSETDHAETYVLDSAINFLVSKTKEILPKAYHDTLNLSK